VARQTGEPPISALVDYSRGDLSEEVSITYVGKESNLLEDVENEIVHDWDDVQQRY